MTLLREVTEDKLDVFGKLPGTTVVSFRSDKISWFLERNSLDRLTNKHCIKYAKIRVFIDPFYEYTILSLYGRTQVSENPFPPIFYPLTCTTNLS